MSNLYSNLSLIYEAMYHSFINYEEEFTFYHNILLKYNCTSVVEIGCGSGNVASRFANSNIEYVGMDLSEEMLAIAKINNPNTVFVKDDMRSFILNTKMDAAIITGRTISYLPENSDVIDCFKAIYKNVNEHGIICFDCIDANKFIPQIDSTKKIIHEASFNNKDYKRESIWKINIDNGFCFDWASTFFESTDKQHFLQIGGDSSTIRAFTKDEMILFLQLTGFAILEIIERPSYAFDTFVIVAKKK